MARLDLLVRQTQIISRMEMIFRDLPYNCLPRFLQTMIRNQLPKMSQQSRFVNLSKLVSTKSIPRDIASLIKDKMKE